MSTDRTIINNHNNYNNNNNNSYSLPSEEEQTVTSSLRSEVASPQAAQIPQESHLLSERVVAAPAIRIDKTIPDNWDFVKLDLFNNASPQDLAKNKNKFKLAISIKLKNRTDWMSFRALLNSPFRNLKRGLDATVYENTHYTNVKNSYVELKEFYSEVRVSKTYQKGQGIKGQTTEELSVVMGIGDKVGEYVINLHFKDQQWIWPLSNILTEAQRKGNMIATVGIRKGKRVTNLKAGDLL
jgi:hypothetical protein